MKVLSALCGGLLAFIIVNARAQVSDPDPLISGMEVCLRHRISEGSYGLSWETDFYQQCNKISKALRDRFPARKASDLAIINRALEELKKP